MPAGIGRKWRRSEKMIPCRVFFCRRIAIFVGALDRGDGTPEIVPIFYLPANDSGVGLRKTDERKQPRVFFQSIAPVLRDGCRDLVPVSGRHGCVAEI